MLRDYTNNPMEMPDKIQDTSIITGYGMVHFVSPKRITWNVFKRRKATFYHSFLQIFKYIPDHNIFNWERQSKILYKNHLMTQYRLLHTQKAKLLFQGIVCPSHDWWQGVVQWICIFTIHKILQNNYKHSMPFYQKTCRKHTHHIFSNIADSPKMLESNNYNL